MGRGIGRFFAESGKRVILYDPFEQSLAIARKALETTSGIRHTADLEEAVSGADLIIESAPEDLIVKRQLYSGITTFLGKNAIISSNTSSFALEVLSENQPFAGRMMITHFFNPADIIPLVEIVKRPEMENATVEAVVSLFRDCGKVPVVLKKDMKGFIANRLQAAVLREACYLLAEGIADAADIDTVMTQSIGTRWALSGPFEIADYGGLDIWEKVLGNLMPVLDNTTQVPAVISEKVHQHNLGLKTGKGFFNYDQNEGRSRIEEWNKKLVEILINK